jgi:sarcosine oxidase / L-pipecolate oxidase
MTKHTLIIGGGIFGMTAALELRRRGQAVRLFDQGPIPYPAAASTDYSKMIRADYGDDEFYADLMLRALEGWDRWNRDWPRPLYHQTGFLLLTHEAFSPGGLELESLKLLRQKGVPIERLGPGALRARYPQWAHERYADGYYNPRGGWAESGAVVAQLAQMARAAGVQLHEGEGFRDFLERGGRVEGISTTQGRVYRADCTIVAAGAWTPLILPEMQDKMRYSGHPVVLLRPTDPAPYRGELFPGWSSDISRTGWYGFPATAEGLVKIANHGPGFPADPRADNQVPDAFLPSFREFVQNHLPELRDAPVAKTRLCLYSDTWDGDFYLCPHPDRPGLIIAAGGSGHGFKFAPMLGEIIADVAQGRDNPWAYRFRWRERGQARREAARWQGGGQ